MPRFPALRRTMLASLLGLGGIVLGASLFAGSQHAGAQVSSFEHDLEFTVVQDGREYTLHIDFLFAPGATEADMTTALDAKAAELEAAGAVRSSHGGGDYSKYVISGPKWLSHSVLWYYNPEGKPESLPSGYPELVAASAVWNNAGAVWTFSPAGTTTAGTGGCATTRDGQNTIGWTELSGTTLAITCTWSGSDGGDGEQFLEFDMQFDPGWGWTRSQITVDTDFQSVATHEMGHALGLGHPPRRDCPGSVMCATYPDRAIIHDLTDDDLGGLYEIYGIAPTPVPPTRVPLPQERGSFHAIAPGAARK